MKERPISMSSPTAYYYEGGSIQREADDPWAIVAEAVEEAADADRLHAVRVGPMRGLAVRELLDAEDIVAMSDDGRLSADDLLAVVSERCGERVEGGVARMSHPYSARRLLHNIMQQHDRAENAAADVIEWAELFFGLDPSSYCDGRDPLPIEFVRGGWVYGNPDAEPSEESLAIIVYLKEPSPETEDVGWWWWVDGRMGSTATLPDAMMRCAYEMARGEVQ